MKGPKCKFCGVEHFGPCPKLKQGDKSQMARLMQQKPVARKIKKGRH